MTNAHKCIVIPTKLEFLKRVRDASPASDGSSPRTPEYTQKVEGIRRGEGFSTLVLISFSGKSWSFVRFMLSDVVKLIPTLGSKI